MCVSVKLVFLKCALSAVEHSDRCPCMHGYFTRSSAAQFQDDALSERGGSDEESEPAAPGSARGQGRHERRRSLIMAGDDRDHDGRSASSLGRRVSPWDGTETVAEATEKYLSWSAYLQRTSTYGASFYAGDVAAAINTLAVDRSAARAVVMKRTAQEEFRRLAQHAAADTEAMKDYASAEDGRNVRVWRLRANLVAHRRRRRSTHRCSSSCLDAPMFASRRSRHGCPAERGMRPGSRHLRRAHGR